MVEVFVSRARSPVAYGEGRHWFTAGGVPLVELVRIVYKLESLSKGNGVSLTLASLAPVIVGGSARLFEQVTDLFRCDQEHEGDVFAAPFPIDGAEKIVRRIDQGSDPLKPVLGFAGNDIHDADRLICYSR